VKVLLVFLIAFSIIPIFAQEKQEQNSEDGLTELENKIEEVTGSEQQLEIISYIQKLIEELGTVRETIVESNQSSNIDLVVGIQIGLVAATLILVFVTWIKMSESNRITRESNNLLKKELESRLRAELTATVGDSNLKQAGDKWIGKVKIVIRNEGHISARHVKVHFKDPTSALTLDQLIRDEEEIKTSYFPIPGSIPPRSNYPEHVLHDTTLDESKPYDLAVWVTYDYADVKNMEFIQIVKINSQSHSVGPLYEKKDIENEKNRLKNQGI